MNFPAKRHLSFWAKSEPHHPLYCHLIDVGLVAGILWDRIYASGWKQHVQHLLGLDAREARHLLVWLAAFHDIGKASPQFQIQNDKLARLVRQSGLPIPDRFHQKLHHGDVSEQIITPHLRKLWGEDNAHFALMAARCTACHHGYPSTVSDENAWAATPEITSWFSPRKSIQVERVFTILRAALKEGEDIMEKCIRYTSDQIIQKLREADSQAARVEDIAQTYLSLGQAPQPLCQKGTTWLRGNRTERTRRGENR